MRIGVVGCGHWGSKHVRVLHNLDEVHKVVGIDPFVERLAKLCRVFPAMEPVTSLEAALPDVDAVVIATPPRSHAAIALQALRAGKHVLIEKPLATSTVEGRQMVAEAARVGRILQVGHTFEHNPAVWKLRELIDDGELGDIYYINSARLNLGLYQRDCNVVWDLAPHDVSILNYLLRTTPVTVQAWGAAHAHSFQEDVAYLRLNYKDPDVTAQIHVSWLDPCKVRRATVVGSRKMAVYDDLMTEEPLRIYDKGVDGTAGTQGLHDMPVAYRNGSIVSPYILPDEPLQVQDQHFVDCILSGSVPRADGHSGLAVVEVLEAATISMREGRVVRLEDLAARDVDAIALG